MAWRLRVVICVLLGVLVACGDFAIVCEVNSL